MTDNAPARPRGGLLLLLVGAAVASLAALVSYGFAAEYGDTRASGGALVLDAVVGSAFVLVVVLALFALALWRSPRGSWVRPMAGVLALAALVAIPAAQVLGVQSKWERYRTAPTCTAGFRSGPAVPVVRASQAAFEEIDHPGRFTGGGSSGIDGCETEMLVRDGTDPLPAYREQLPALGWTVVTDSAELVRAERDGQAVEVRPSDGGAWIWIGPEDLQRPDLEEGEVGPRT